MSYVAAILIGIVGIQFPSETSAQSTTSASGCLIRGDILSCPAGSEFEFNGDRTVLDAFLECPLDSVAQSEFVEASQQGKCQCADTSLRLSNVSIDQAEPIDCDCFACPFGATFGFSYSCDRPIINNCSTFNCLGECNGDLYAGVFDVDPSPISCAAILANETECSSRDDCFWCQQQGSNYNNNETTGGVCRNSELQCPGGPDFDKSCHSATNETICMDREDCVWCEPQDNDEDGGICRRSQAECPRQGRGNPCFGLNGDDCESIGCLWCEDQGLCTSSRGNRQCDEEGGGGGGNPCPRFEDDTSCTSNLACRWCPTDDDGTMCKHAQSSCDDGSNGIRGNPCEDAGNSEESCPSGCVWCTLKSECQKPNDRGCIPEGNVTMEYNECQRIDVAPDCNATSECKWCEAQSRCKLSTANCDAPLGEAGIEFYEDGRRAKFAIQDDGLGTSDPNAVSVTLEYLFEVAGQGDAIIPSLVDFASEEFTITQTVGNFFGENNKILARRIMFYSSIDGVGTIGILAFVIMSNGTITTEAGESWSVKEGDVKFNIDMSDWSFCDAVDNPCGGLTDTSQFVDVAVKIQGRNEAPEHTEMSTLMFDLGGDVPLTLSNQVEVDGYVQGMPEGFPRIESTDQGTLFVFRFPRFIDAVKYDPVIGFHQALILPPPETPPPVSQEPSAGIPTSEAPSLAPSAQKMPKENEPADDGGLTTGAIVGIVVASVLGCCVAVVLLVFSQRNGRERGREGLKSERNLNEATGFVDETGAAADEDDEENASDGEEDSEEEDESDDEEDSEEEDESDEEDGSDEEDESDEDESEEESDDDDSGIV